MTPGFSRRDLVLTVAGAAAGLVGGSLSNKIGIGANLREYTSNEKLIGDGGTYAQFARFSTYHSAASCNDNSLHGVNTIEILGYREPGDCQTRLIYSSITDKPDPIKPWHLQSCGRWWILNVAEVCPEAFGADGTVERDTAALQACQDHPASSIIRSDRKTYLLGKEGLRGVGGKAWVGRGSTIRQAAIPKRNMIYYFNVTDFKIKDIKLDGAGYLDSQSGSYPGLLPCIYVGECSNFEISDCAVGGFKTCGLLFNVVTNGAIKNNYIDQGSPTGNFANYGICVLGSVGSLSHGIHIIGNKCLGCNIAVNAKMTWIVDNQISGWGYSAGINVAAAESCSSLKISGNYCFDSMRKPDRDGYFMDGIECWAPDTICENNHCFRNIGSGIGWGSRRGLCNGNNCHDNGIGVNEFKNLGYSERPVFQGILVLYQDEIFSGEDSYITNNILYDTRPIYIKTQTFGYREKPGANFKNITSSNNKCFGNIIADRAP